MTRKSSLLFLFLTLLRFYGWAQSGWPAHINSHEFPRSEGDTRTLTGIIRADTDGTVYSTHYVNKEVSIQKHDGTNKYALVYSNPVRLPPGEKPEQMLVFGRQFLLVTSKMTNQALVLDFIPVSEDGKVGKPTMASIENSKKWALSGLVFRNVRSAQNALLAVWLKDPKSGSAKIILLCIDAQGKTVYQSNALFTASAGEDYSLRSLVLLEDLSCAMIIAREYNLVTKTPQGSRGREMLLVSFKDKGTKRSDLSLQLKNGEKILDILCDKDSTGNLIACGYYGRETGKEDKDKGASPADRLYGSYAEGAIGFFVFKIDGKAISILSEATGEFPADVKDSFTPAGKKDPDGMISGKICLQRIVQRSDGGCYVVSEYRDKFTLRYPEEKTRTDLTIFGDILVASCTAEGKVDWIKNIRKLQLFAYKVWPDFEPITSHVILSPADEALQQFSTVPPYLRYHSEAILSNEDKLLFLFNDVKANEKIPRSVDQHELALAASYVLNPYTGKDFEKGLEIFVCRETLDKAGNQKRKYWLSTNCCDLIHPMFYKVYAPGKVVFYNSFPDHGDGSCYFSQVKFY